MNLNPIRRLPSNLRARRPNQLEQERENSERIQEASYRKAINDEEVPVKMKHVRLLILATHNEKNAVTFWRLAQLFNPLNTDVTAWKFCHCLHMIVRDGHKHVIKDTLRNIDMVKNVRQHFYHLTHGYGRLIVRYCDLLLCKVQFHQRNPRFPSNLSVSPDELHSIAETDANNYFELAVEMFEYTECILKLYTEVFSSLDQSRAVSNTKMGQCRLAPLITCIQDSTSIYDLTVRIMFNLHKALTVDLLVGHRERFNTQFPQLHSFYENSANLQYFKTLNITIPQLPREPPNFLIEAELHAHVAPVVVLQPETDDTVTEPEEMPVNELSLVDTSDGPPPVPPHPDFSRDASMIESLTKELEELRLQLQQTRSQESHSRQQMAHTINDLQATIASLESSLLSEKQAKESVMVQVEAAAVGAEAVTKLAHEEKQRKLYEDKFNKMREVYHNFRDEHVTLIRSKAEVEREREGERSTREVLETSVNRLEEQINNQEETLKQMRATSNEERENLLARVSELQNSLDNAIGSADKQIAKSQHTTELQVQACVRACCATSAKILTQTMQRAASERHAEINSTPEFTLTFEGGIRASISSIPALVGEYLSSHVAHAPSLISTLEDFTLLLSSFIMYATAASHVSADIEKAHELVCSVQSLGEQSTALFSAVQDSRTVQDNIDTIATTFDRCVSLVSWCVDSSISTDDIAEQMEREMEAMRRAIAEASASTASMLEKARKQDTGLKLEVNESLLGICMELFSAVQILVLRAAELQQEVASKSNAGASPKEFYKRNHRWTQGLITGAKAVAIACQALMSAADAVVSKGGRFEEVIVSSREIAASSMQLVMASRVKADPSSNNLKNVNGAAKNISTLTGNLVATAESCRDKVSTVALDFSQLSLHQSKRLEMDTLVKVLEAEKHLEQQREKLGQLRKHHYQLAGEMEERQRDS